MHPQSDPHSPGILFYIARLRSVGRVSLAQGDPVGAAPPTGDVLYKREYRESVDALWIIVDHCG